MASFDDEINKFFAQNINQLTNSYPGLRLELFKEKIFETLAGSSSEQALVEILADTLTGKPLEYISGSKFFYRSSFFVDNRVLIPRSETEILVEDVIDLVQRQKIESLAEVGVGSGAITISIARECSHLDIWAGDISAPALEVAGKNIQQWQKDFAPGTSVELVQTDRLKGVEKTFECIVSNPPYIKDSDLVHPMVDRYEPRLALRLNDQEYQEWFNLFFKQVVSCLNREGWFFMEGHEDHLEELKILAQNFFTEVKLKKDYTDRLRFLYAKK